MASMARDVTGSRALRTQVRQQTLLEAEGMACAAAARAMRAERDAARQAAAQGLSHHGGWSNPTGCRQW